MNMEKTDAGAGNGDEYVNLTCFAKCSAKSVQSALKSIR